MLVITASFGMLLATCVPAVLGLQTRVEQGLPKIGTFHVYDLDYHRPSGLSFEDARSRGLIVGDGPAVWESAADYDRESVNTGNLVWSLGARMLLGNSSELAMGPENWPNDNSLSAIFLATGPLVDGSYEGTQLAENKAMGHPLLFNDAVGAAEKPTMVVGMGIGKYDGDRDFKCMDVVSDSRTKSLRKLQARITKLGGFVGLRGKCSESVMRRLGFSSFEAMGCPSLFINTNPFLGKKLQSKFNDLPHKARTDLVVAVAMPSKYDEQGIVPFLAKVLRYYPKSILINQNVDGETLFSRACKELGVEMPARESFLYYDALEWREKLSQVDLVVSARIHGSMMAIAAQTPTVVIPLDMRVLEMVEAMQLPHILPTALPDDVHDFVVKGSSKFDGQAFDEQRRAYAARYKELFHKIGLTPNPALSQL